MYVKKHSADTGESLAKRASCANIHVQPVISRDYRGDVDLSLINHFLPMLLSLEEEGTASPILVHEKVTFVYIKHNNLYCIPTTVFCMLS